MQNFIGDPCHVLLIGWFCVTSVVITNSTSYDQCKLTLVNLREGYLLEDFKELYKSIGKPENKARMKTFKSKIQEIKEESKTAGFFQRRHWNSESPAESSLFVSHLNFQISKRLFVQDMEKGILVNEPTQ